MNSDDSAYLLFVAAVVGHFQGSLEETEADLVDGWFEKVVLHQTVNHKEARPIMKECIIISF